MIKPWYFSLFPMVLQRGAFFLKMPQNYIFHSRDTDVIKKTLKFTKNMFFPYSILHWGVWYMSHCQRLCV